jgi:hypothetical protein
VGIEEMTGMKKIVADRGHLGTTGSAKKKGASRFSLIAAPAAFALMTIGARPEAHAQCYGCGEALVPLFVTGMVVEGGAVVGGLMSGIGSSVHLAQGTRGRGWFIASYVFGGLNIVGAGVWKYVADNNFGSSAFTGLSLAHATLAAFDLILPTAGFIGSRDGQQARLTPVVLGGLDAGGRRWNGAGLQLSHF